MKRNEAIRRFRAHWRDIAKSNNPRDKHSLYLDKYSEKFGYVSSNCFLCEYTGKHGCDLCPIAWIPELDNRHTLETPCLQPESLYLQWKLAHGERARPLALKISKLPLKKKRKVNG